MVWVASWYNINLGVFLMTLPVWFPIENFSSAVHVGTAGCIIDDNWRGAIERRLPEVRERQRPVARVDIREANALRAAVKRVLNEVPAHHCGNTILAQLQQAGTQRVC